MSARTKPAAAQMDDHLPPVPKPTRLAREHHADRSNGRGASPPPKPPFDGRKPSFADLETGSVFRQYINDIYPYRFAGTLHVGTILGGTPTDEKVAEAWLKTKITEPDDLRRQRVAETMVERGVTADEAVEQVVADKHLNGFKRGSSGLYIEGRQLKACIKEAVSIAADSGKIKARGLGQNNARKGILSYVAEHVFVVEDRLYLGVSEPSGIQQRFVHTFRGTGIQYEEYVEDAKIAFTLITDHDFSEKDWAAIWLIAEQQGIGASRSQSYGRFAVTRWDRVQ